jgi:arylsulfatase A-like enzyme
MSPNILIILTDQQRTDSLSCYGSDFTHTPHLDRLASEGARFDRAYCVNPVCTPARASIFTGQYVSRHGAFNVGVNTPEDAPMISHALTQAGYRTHYVGKAHFQSFGSEPVSGSAMPTMESVNGWEKHYPTWHGPYYGFESVELALGHATYGMAGHYGAWVREQIGADAMQALQHARSLAATSFGGEGYDWDIPLRLHNSVWTADRTIDFLQHHDHAQPFFLVASFEDPHHPHCVPTELSERVDPQAVLLPDYVEGELDDKPPHFNAARHGQLAQSPILGRFKMAGQGGGADYRHVAEQDARVGRASYYTLCRLIDQQVGRMLNALDELGLVEDTLVIFTTDHGELLGDHGIWMKGPFHYEQLVRIPYIMRWPCGFRGGQTPASLINQVDIAPTVLAAAGVHAQAPMDGFDALPYLRGEKDTIRNSTLVECVDDPAGLRLKTLVTRDRKLTWYAGHDYGELYDLTNDPHERINQWGNPDYASDRAQLLSKLLNLMEPLERRVQRDYYA